METNINDINSQNVINKLENQTNTKIGIIPLVLGLGLLVSLLMVSILVKERKGFNISIANLQKQVQQLQKEIDKSSNSINIQPESEAVEADPTTNPAIYTCDYWRDKVYDDYKLPYYDFPSGTLTISGSIIKKVEDEVFAEEEKVTKIYLAVPEQKENPQKLFYKKYKELVEKQNLINDIEGQKLLFNLGILENSKLISTAKISDNLKKKIISLIDKNENIDLKLTTSIGEGRSVDDTFSFACEVSE